MENPFEKALEQGLDIRKIFAERRFSRLVRIVKSFFKRMQG